MDEQATDFYAPGCSSESEKMGAINSCICRDSRTVEATCSSNSTQGKVFLYPSFPWKNSLLLKGPHAGSKNNTLNFFLPLVPDELGSRKSTPSFHGGAPAPKKPEMTSKDSFDETRELTHRDRQETAHQSPVFKELTKRDAVKTDEIAQGRPIPIGRAASKDSDEAEADEIPEDMHDPTNSAEVKTEEGKDERPVFEAPKSGVNVAAAAEVDKDVEKTAAKLDGNVVSINDSPPDPLTEHTSLTGHSEFPLKWHTRNILIVGKIGAGKATIANHILGEDKFKVSRSVESVTKLTAIRDISHCIVKDGSETTARSFYDYTIQLIDTVGLSNVLNQQQITFAIENFIKQCPDGIHLAIFVLKNGRVTKEDKTAIEYFMCFCFGHNLL